MSVEEIHAELATLENTYGRSLQNPPNCYRFMRGEYRAYESRTSLTVSFPVLPEYHNPVGAMQGGLITAAVDNTIGPLSYLAARAPCTTLDLHTQYLRSVAADDTITVTARVISRGSQTLTFSADVVNGKGKLIARASATMLVVGERKSG